MKKTLLLLLCGGFAMAQSIGVTTFATGFETVTQINHAGDSRLFVTENTGAIKIVNADGSVNPQNFLSLPASELTVSGEQGLIGTAFHPDYAENGYFYISYTRASDGATVFKRYSVSANPDIADAASGETILEIPQFATVHKSGNMKFGPDGYLYIASGDGGMGGNHSQLKDNLYGKMLRIDVDGAFPYSIPPGNAFTEGEGLPEIYSYGLRNPWKFSFDRANGDLWITDVGQANVEEVNHLTAPISSGTNFGWPCYEGSEVYPANDFWACPDPADLFFPTSEYLHQDGGTYNGCSITGGYVYRGSLYPALQGTYFFTDYCQTQLGTIAPDGTWAFTTNLSLEMFCTSFGEDLSGELYVAGGGNLYKIKDTDMSVTDSLHPRPTLYPNPAKNEIRVHGLDSGFQLEVTDAAGRNLAQRKFQDPSANLLENLSLKPGLYVFQIISDGGTKNTYKVVIE